MDVKMQLIALRQIKHTDRHTILSAYSRQEGRVAFAIPAGQGKEAARMRALLMPLGMVECVAHVKPGNDVMRMSEPRALAPLQGLRAHPLKSCLALFIAEVLETVLREGGPDCMLWDYISHSVRILDTLPTQNTANFHLCFLYGLGRFLGIEPDISAYSRGMIFDMHDGVFRHSAPLHNDFLSPQQSAVVVTLSRITYANMHKLRLTRGERNETLDVILRYYALHYTSFSSLKSLDVLRVLF